MVFGSVFTPIWSGYAREWASLCNVSSTMRNTDECIKLRSNSLAKQMKVPVSRNSYTCDSRCAAFGAAVCVYPHMVTWLILPVVICLSQRLSHACLSISDLYCETANGSLNQLWFIWWYLTTWITVVILELIHAGSPDFGRDVFIR